MDIKRHISKEEIKIFEEIYGSIEDTRVVDIEDTDVRAVMVGIENIEMFKECLELFGTEKKLYLNIYKDKKTNKISYMDEYETEEWIGFENNVEKYESLGTYSYWVMSFEDEDRWDGMDMTDTDYIVEFVET